MLFYCILLLNFKLYAECQEEIKNNICQSDILNNYFAEDREKSCTRYNKRKLQSSMKFWKFSENQILYNTFPIDQLVSNHVRQVSNVLFSMVKPNILETDLKLAVFSEDVLTRILDMDSAITETKDFVDFASGNVLLKSSVPLSHRYGGHQFGYWSGQLGDGRAHMLGEYVNNKNERWELQLKGSGKTPYSRHGDGFAVIRSSVREFLCSEAMHYLGIPTSRAATLVVSKDPVIRDQFYNGNIKKERAAVVLRLAQSWFRFGSLEILAKKHEIPLLRKQVDFIIENYFPQVGNDDNKYLAFFNEVVKQTAEMIAQWMSVGFTHGVMNTDNFSILSITIDYGPFGFLDEYNPEFVPNTSDDEARYSYEKQPDVGFFNLDKLRIALAALLTDSQREQLKTGLNGLVLYTEVYKSKFMELFRKKLGLVGVEPNDEYLVALLLKMMAEQNADFTMTFRELGELTIENMRNNHIPSRLWALTHLFSNSNFKNWLILYLKRIDTGDPDLEQQDNTRKSLMLKTNPRYILRNWIAQSVIEKVENDDFSELQKLSEILKRPFDYQIEAELLGYADPPPKWASDIKVSCSS
ncbi:unnamed protein product [Owenia fusiformis]|uniref:Selenoprotein O n=1 Tax=Owenia fusiformis TaxID=6347 RepID=A0A8J1XPK5_OWEFU|nr:unnamed protein product [Owenia fusiformis]